MSGRGPATPYPVTPAALNDLRAAVGMIAEVMLGPPAQEPVPYPLAKAGR